MELQIEHEARRQGEELRRQQGDMQRQVTSMRHKLDEEYSRVRSLSPQPFQAGRPGSPLKGPFQLGAPPLDPPKLTGIPSGCSPLPSPHIVTEVPIVGPPAPSVATVVMPAPGPVP